MKSSCFHTILCALCAVLVIACSSEQGDRTALEGVPEDRQVSAEKAVEETTVAGTRDYSLGIYPETGYRETVFSAVPKNFSLDNASVRWIKDGQEVAGEGGRTFQPQDIERGGSVQVRALVDGQELVSPVVTILNSPPAITNVVLRHEASGAGLFLFVEVDTDDPDDDKVSLSYEWIKNRVPAGSGTRITSPVKKDDAVKVTITPFDGIDYGHSEVIKRTVYNAYPIIHEDTVFTFDEGVYTFRVSATDPDGDTLTYALKSGPDGMIIDKDTGNVTWNVPDDFIGEVPVTVAVTDANQGETTWDLTLTIEEEEEETKR